MDYKKNTMTSKDRKKDRVNKRAKVTIGSRDPKHGKRKHYHCTARTHTLRERVKKVTVYISR
jgi:hypothetical protein